MRDARTARAAASNFPTRRAVSRKVIAAESTEKPSESIWRVGSRTDFARLMRNPRLSKKEATKRNREGGECQGPRRVVAMDISQVAHELQNIC